MVVSYSQPAAVTHSRGSNDWRCITRIRSQISGWSITSPYFVSDDSILWLVVSSAMRSSLLPFILL